MKRFLDLADFERDEVLALLELTRRLEKYPEPHALAGKILGLVFFNPSLRTRSSFTFERAWEFWCRRAARPYDARPDEH